MPHIITSWLNSNKWFARNNRTEIVWSDRQMIPGWAPTSQRRSFFLFWNTISNRNLSVYGISSLKVVIYYWDTHGTHLVQTATTFLHGWKQYAQKRGLNLIRDLKYSTTIYLCILKARYNINMQYVPIQCKYTQKILRFFKWDWMHYEIKADLAKQTKQLCSKAQHKCHCNTETSILWKHCA